MTPRYPVLLAAAYAGALFVLGLFLHTMPATGTAENDDYVGLAAALLAGNWRRDVFHPLLYPTMIAATGLVVGQLFIAAKLVSAVFAGVLAWSVYRLASHAMSPICGFAAAAATCLHPAAVIGGMLAADTIVSTALCTVTILACVRAVEAPTARRACWLGFLFAISYWTRYSTSALLVPIALALVLPRSVSKTARLRHVVLFFLAAGLALLPHCFMTFLQWGYPLHDENWRNLAMRHYFDMDWARLFDMPFSGWRSVLSHDPERIAANAVQSLGLLFGWQLPAQLTGHRADPMLLDWIAYGLVLVGLVSSLVGWTRRSLSLGTCFAVCYLTALTAVFVPWPRHVLLTLPVLIALGTSGLYLVQVTSRRWRVLQRYALAVCVFAFVLVFSFRTPDALQRFVAMHARAEYQAICRLAATYGPQTRIYCPMSAALFRNADLQFVPVDLPVLRAGQDRDDFHAMLLQMAARGEADFMVLGVTTMWGRWNFQHYAGGDFPAPLEVAARGPDAVVLASGVPRVWIEEMPGDGGVVELRFARGRAAAEAIAIGLGIVGPDGQGHWLVLPNNHEPTMTMPVAAGAMGPGTWKLVPVIVTTKGVQVGLVTTLVGK